MSLLTCIPGRLISHEQPDVATSYNNLGAIHQHQDTRRRSRCTRNRSKSRPGSMAATASG